MRTKGILGSKVKHTTMNANNKNILDGCILISKPSLESLLDFRLWLIDIGSAYDGYY